MKKITGIALLLLLTSLLYGCDGDLTVIRYEFGQFPRIVYIVGVDTELDFANVTLISTARNGSQYEFLFWLPESGFQRFATRIEHSIDFTTPGVYQVRITWAGREQREYLQVIFLIQVIDAEIFYQLSNPEPQPPAKCRRLPRRRDPSNFRNGQSRRCS